MKAGRPSSTALLIARSLLLADLTPLLRPMLAGEIAVLTQRLLNAANPAPWFDFALRHGWARNSILAAEWLLLPGIFLHYLARKRYLDTLAHEAIDAGCRQLVVLGSGLDTLAMRIQASNPKCACFEIDHPVMQTIKQSVYGKDPVLISADLLKDSLVETLQAQPRFDRNLPTLFVAEGLLMYFPPALVARLFRELAAFSVPGSRFAFTFMEARHGRPLAFHNGRRVIDWWLRWCGESFQWGLARPEAGNFSAQNGWRLASLSSPEELRRRFLAPHGLHHAPLAVGESVALALRSDETPATLISV